MHDPVKMAVEDCRCDLEEERLCIFLSAAMILKIVEKFAAGKKFEDDVERIV